MGWKRLQQTPSAKFDAVASSALMHSALERNHQGQQWPQGMEEVLRNHPCTAHCTGNIGLNAACVGAGSNNCRSIKLWYNMLNRYVLPPTESNNVWNWRDTTMYIGPQRRPSGTESLSNTVTSTPTKVLTPVAPFSSSTSQYETQSASDSGSITAMSLSGEDTNTPSTSVSAALPSQSMSVSVSDVLSQSVSPTPSISFGESATLQPPKRIATVSHHSHRTVSPSAGPHSRSESNRTFSPPTTITTQSLSVPQPSATLRDSRANSLTQSLTAIVILTRSNFSMPSHTVHPTLSVELLLTLSPSQSPPSPAHSFTRSDTVTDVATPSPPRRNVTVTLVQEPPPVVVVVPVAVKDSQATSSGVAAMGTLAGVDPGGAAVQAVLSFLACRSTEANVDGSFGLWLAMLPISPFATLGLRWAVIGNIGLGALVLCVQYAVLRCRAACNRELPAQQSAAASVRFPSLGFAVMEWLLSGVAVCSVALAGGTGGSSVFPRAVGAAGVVTTLAALYAWYYFTRRTAGRYAAVAWEKVAEPLCPRLLRVVGPRTVWTPKWFHQQWGILFESMRMHCAEWRWMFVVVATFVAALTGASGLHPSACRTTLAMSSIILLVTALVLLVVKPHRMPTENYLNPAKFLLLSATCAIELSLDGDEKAQGLALAGYLQSCITVLRLAVKLYTNKEFERQEAFEKQAASHLIDSEESPTVVLLVEPLLEHHLPVVAVEEETVDRLTVVPDVDDTLSKHQEKKPQEEALPNLSVPQVKEQARPAVPPVQQRVSWIDEFVDASMNFSNVSQQCVSLPPMQLNFTQNGAEEDDGL